MRIAILLVHEYETGGTVEWARNLMSARHPDVHVVRRRGYSTDLGIDQQHDLRLRNEDLVDTLNTFDHVLLQATFDVLNLKRKDATGWWVDVMVKLTVPWSTFVHTDTRLMLDVPKTWPLLSALPTFSQRLFSHSMLPADRLAPETRQIRLELPYTPVEHLVASQPGAGGVLLMSRFAREKNWALAFRAALLFDARNDIAPTWWTVAGLAADSPGESAPFSVHRLLVNNHGATSVQAPVNPHKADPWRVLLPGGSTVTYWGAYDRAQQQQLLTSHAVAVNTTPRIGGSFGPVEYSTLESLDHGLAVAQPRESGELSTHLSTALYDSNDRIVQMPKTLSGGHDDIAKSLCNAIATARTMDPRHAAYNQQNLRVYNAPGLIINQIVSEISK